MLRCRDPRTSLLQIGLNKPLPERKVSPPGIEPGLSPPQGSVLPLDYGDLRFWSTMCILTLFWHAIRRTNLRESKGDRHEIECSCAVARHIGTQGIDCGGAGLMKRWQGSIAELACIQKSNLNPSRRTRSTIRSYCSAKAIHEPVDPRSISTSPPEIDSPSQTRGAQCLDQLHTTLP